MWITQSVSNIELIDSIIQLKSVNLKN